MNLPNNMSVLDAPLPVIYERAKKALAECSRIDECIDWRDKAEALRSYARQAEDKELELLAKRVKIRAIRRTGELLLQFDGRGRHRRSSRAVDGR